MKKVTFFILNLILNVVLFSVFFNSLINYDFASETEQFYAYISKMILVVIFPSLLFQVLGLVSPNTQEAIRDRYLTWFSVIGVIMTYFGLHYLHLSFAK